jgi:hypothetical protein
MNIKKNKQINIFFCPSWYQIEEIISLTRENRENLIFVVENKDLYFFFKKFFNKSKIIFLNSPKSVFGFNLLKCVKNLYLNYLEKKKIKLIFNNYIKTKVYCAEGFNLVQMAYAAQILSSNNEIFLYSNDLKLKKFLKRKFNFKIFLYNIYIKILYNISCYSVADPDNKLYSIYSDQYYKSVNAKKIKNRTVSSILKKFAHNKIKFLNKKKILLLSSYDAKNENLIHVDRFKIWLNEFIKIVGLENIIFKKKFINEQKFFKEKLFEEAPSYLPASLLLYKVHIVIGYNSATLFQAANAGCQAISLLDLLKKKEIDPKLNYYKKVFADNLINKNKIFFPKTINDFKKIILNTNK